MSLILACLDGSRYSDAVCDYAGWFADHLQDPIALLHVDEDASGSTPAQTPGAILGEAQERLTHQGVGAVTSLSLKGRFLDKLAELAPRAELVLLGKRGCTAALDGSLGGNVEAAIHETTMPLCLISSVFLPISRALVVLDGDARHRRAVDFVASHPALAALRLDLVVMSDKVELAEEKLCWAREALGSRQAEVFAMDAQRPDEVATRMAERGGFDLLVISREAAFGPSGGSEQLGEFWAQRAPILIC